MSRRTFLAAVTVLAVMIAAFSIEATRLQAMQVSVDVSIGMFRNSLAPYGRWVTHERFGTVWQPRVAGVAWRPYTEGHWVYTDAAWLWVSDEPFGWATYHYGRWFLDPRIGWVWVPDATWSPAWVAWRDSDEYVGWAPLPPDLDIETDVVFEPVIDPFAFTFVRMRYFVDPGLPRYIEPPTRNAFIVRATVNATHYSIEGSRVINHGLPIERVERVVGRAVPRLTIEASAAVGPAREFRDRVVVSRPVNAVPQPLAAGPGRAVLEAPAGRLRLTGGSVVTPGSPPPADRPSPFATPPRLSSSSGGRTGGDAVPRNDANASGLARHQQELRALEHQQIQARSDLEKRHARERQRPPENMSPRALNERQAAETKELLTRQDRQRKEVEARQARERGGEER